MRGIEGHGGWLPLAGTFPHGSLMASQTELDLGGGGPVSHAEATSHWFDLDPRACYLVSCDGHFMAANRQGRAMIEDGRILSVRSGLLTFNCENSQRDLRDATDSVCRREADRIQRLVRADNAQWRVVNILPTVDRTCAFVSVSPGVEEAPQDLEVLVDAFSLTRTEAHVLGEILDGHAPKDAGRRLEMSTHTVRSHLRNIYAKLNVRGIVGTIRLATRLTNS